MGVSLSVLSDDREWDTFALLHMDESREHMDDDIDNFTYGNKQWNNGLSREQF